MAITPSDTERIRALHRSGLLSQSEIARVFNTSQSTISRLVSPEHFTKAQIDQMIVKLNRACTELLQQKQRQMETTK